MKINSIFIKHLLLLTVLLLVSCSQSDEKFKSYSVGFSTPNVGVWVSSTTLDHRIEISGGLLQGSWEEASKTNSIFNEPMPHEIYVQWEENKSGIRYEATLKLVDDLATRARKLPTVTYVPSNDQNVGAIYLIIGMATDGKVTVWLSNYPYSQQSIVGRTLDIIGKTQGHVINPILLNTPTNK